VFIHGFSGRPQTTWADFPELLAADPRLDGWDVYSLGYTTTTFLDLAGLWKADPSIVTLSDGLRTTLGLPDFKRYRAIALIAHSMGGLVVQRSLVDDPSIVSRTTHVLLFGTPNAGLAKANFFRFWKRSLDDMAEGGSFVRGLRERWEGQFGSKPPFQLWAVAGDQDEFVPPRSSIEPFPFAVRHVVVGDHLSMVKPQSVQHPSVQLVLGGLVGQAAPGGPASSARSALERQGFYATIERLEKVEGLDERGLVELALALEGVGRSDDAIVKLEQQIQPEYLDARGVLAGRVKRRWRVTSRRSDCEKARELYAEALNLAIAASRWDQAYYHAINVAYLDLAAGDQTAARNMANQVLEFCAQAPATRWRSATEGEAYLLLGEGDRSVEHYRHAAASHGVTPRELDSMYQQAMQVASLVNDANAARQLEEVLRMMPL
jgi:hypothetical protein